MSGSEFITRFERASETYKDKTAFVEQGREIGYASLNTLVKETLSFLHRRNIRGGERIILRMGNSVGDIAAGIGVMAAGACLIPMAAEATVHERDEYATSCLATHELCRTSHGLLLKRLGEPEDIHAHPEIGNALIIRPTSGTTGRRKGVMLSDASITGRIDAVNSVLEMGPEDTVLWTLPVSFHLVVSILLYLLHGAAIVLAENIYPDTLLALSDRYPVTMLYGAPRQYSMLSSHRSGAGFPHLRWAISTGTFLMDGVAHAFFNRYGHTLRQAYGLIEVGLAAFNYARPPCPADSVGMPVPGHSIMVRGKDGRPLEEGETGEILVKGPGMFTGYADSPDFFLEDGWFSTGDSGFFRGGALFVKGRSCSAFHVAGMKVFPEEIESCLLAHEAVSNVRVAASSHPRLGDVISAEVVVKEGVKLDERELYTYCRRYLAPWKIPLGFRFVSSVATTTSGKVRRR